MSDIVTIKGLKYGLQLTFAKGATFDDVQANLLDKLQSGDGSPKSKTNRCAECFIGTECFSAQN